MDHDHLAATGQAPVAVVVTVDRGVELGLTLLDLGWVLGDPQAWLTPPGLDLADTPGSRAPRRLTYLFTLTDAGTGTE